MNRNILVTGASSGFGLLIANELHRKGYKVIGTSRNPEKNAVGSTLQNDCIRP